MKKILYSILTLLFVTPFFAQQNQLWRGFFSFAEVTDIAATPIRVFATSENAVFSKSLVTNELKTTTSINGFKAETITAMHFSVTKNKTFVGNDNGLLLVVNEADGSVFNVVDIVNKPSIAPNKKKINHLYENDGKLYISCDFGLCVYNLATMEFGDTYFIGPTGQEVEVLQTTVFNGMIYAVTRNNGIRRASVANPNLIDFSQWQEFDAGSWLGAVTFNNRLLLASANNRMYSYTNAAIQEVYTTMQQAVDFKSFNDRLVYTSANHVYVFDPAMVLLAHITQIPDVVTTFTCGVATGNNIFIGTKDKGMYSTTTTNSMVFQNNTPDGPVRNKIFSLKKAPSALWVLYGDYDRYYNPYPLDAYGISKFKESSGWSLIPYEELSGAKSLSRVTLNPNNENQVFVSSYYSGLLKIENDAVVTLYTQLNTGNNGLESLPPPNNNDIRINGPAFDRRGNLWMTNSLVAKGLKVLRADNQWVSYDLSNATVQPETNSYGPLIVDKNNTKWIPSVSNGLIGFNENYGNKFITIKSGTDSGNLADNDVRTVAVDTRNQLWIGTNKGLRILPSVDRFLTETSLTTNAIIILEDGLAQELFYQQVILDIAVDGSNNKWLSIAGGGVFQVSPNGQSVLHKFTKENSPLPSNNINDIEIDGVTGEVFFATDKGMVSFQGTATKANENLNNVYVFPNPVRPGFEGDVNISGLIDKANVKITDIEGNLVYETTSQGGTITWDTRAFGKYKVASGVYMIFISSEDGSETKVKKVMVIR